MENRAHISSLILYPVLLNPSSPCGLGAADVLFSLSLEAEVPLVMKIPQPSDSIFHWPGAQLG